MHKFTRDSLLDLVDDLAEFDEARSERERCKRATLRLVAEHKSRRGETDDLIGLGSDFSEDLIIQDEVMELTSQLKRRQINANLANRILKFFQNDSLNFTSLRASSILGQFIFHLTNAMEDCVNKMQIVSCIIQIFQTIFRDEANIRYADKSKILDILGKIEVNKESRIKEKIDDLRSILSK